MSHESSSIEVVRFQGLTFISILDAMARPRKQAPPIQVTERQTLVTKPNMRPKETRTASDIEAISENSNENP